MELRMEKNSFTFNFKKLPKACVLALGLHLLTVAVSWSFLLMTNGLPAPMFTGRLSLDEKIRFYKNKKPESIDVVTVGSSTALNNISSEYIRKIARQDNEYFNFGAWGIRMFHLDDYWGFLENYIEPRLVIICANPYEFTRSKAKIELNQKDLIRYIDGWPEIIYLVKYYNRHFLKRMIEVGKFRKSTNLYASLKFDDNGGALLEIPPDEINDKRWKEQFVTDRLDEKNYLALDLFIKKLKQKNIKVVYVVSPMREHYIKSEDAQTIENHWSRIEEILSSNNMEFINMHKKLQLSDNFFVDSSHLNKLGSEFFTQELVGLLDDRGII